MIIKSGDSKKELKYIPKQDKNIGNLQILSHLCKICTY